MTSSISGQDSSSRSSRCRCRHVAWGRVVSGVPSAGRGVSVEGSIVTLIAASPDNGSRGHATLDVHAVLAINLGQVDAHDLLARRGHVLADMIGADGQLAMAP